jgi:hypothetical protein
MSFANSRPYSVWLPFLGLRQRGSEFQFNLSDLSTHHFCSNITIWFYIHKILYSSAAYFIIPAGLVLRQGYIPEEHGSNQHKIPI